MMYERIWQRDTVRTNLQIPILRSSHILCLEYYDTWQGKGNWYEKQRFRFFTFMWSCIVTNFFILKPTDAPISPKFILSKKWTSTCFGQFLCPSSGVHSLYTCHCYMSYRFVDSFRAGSGWTIPVLLESRLQTCMTHTSAKCTVNGLLMMGRGTARNM